MKGYRINMGKTKKVKMTKEQIEKNKKRIIKKFI